MIPAYFATMNQEQINQDLLAEIHAISSGIKPVATWIAREAIQTARECCGGHGYSTCNRLGVIKNEQEPSLTYEGDNWVLIQQTAKYLLGVIKLKISGKAIQSPLGTLNFLNSQIDKCNAKSDADFRNPIILLQALKVRVLYLLEEAGKKLQEELLSGKDSFTAWNDSQVFACQLLAKAFIEYLIVDKFMQAIAKVNNKSLQQALETLSILYSLNIICNNLDILLESEHFTSTQSKAAKQTLLSVLPEVKKNSVALIDAVAIPDELLYSPIGLSNGEALKNLYNCVISNPGCFERPSYWHDIKIPSNLGSKRPYNKIPYDNVSKL